MSIQNILKLPQNFTITAHAGSFGSKANTLDSIKTCLDFIGFDGCIEVDVRFNASGEPILSHNPPIAGEKYVKLSELFALLSNYGTHVNLDMKKHNHMREVQRLAEEYGVLPQLFFTGVKFHKIRRVRQGAPKIPYYVNVNFLKYKNNAGFAMKRLAEKIRRSGALGLNTGHYNTSEKMLAALRKNNLLLSVFTVDNPSAMRRMLELGADNITTRRPDVLRALISESNGNADND